MKIIKVIIGILIVIFLIIGLFSYFDNKSAWSTAFLWSGISELPAWSTHDRIETRGSMFTREFIITFTGTREQIEDWIKKEPTFQDIKREDVDVSIFRYILKPQGGANWAEVIIDLSNGSVEIRTYWS